LASDGYIAIRSIESNARKRPTPLLHSSERQSIELGAAPSYCLIDRPETNLCGIPLELRPDIF
jgi:hypothetical protein